MTISSRIRNRRSLRKTGTWPDDSSSYGLEALQAWAASDDTAPIKRKDRILHLVKKHRTRHNSTSIPFAKHDQKRNPSTSLISKPSNISAVRPKHESQNRAATASIDPQPTSVPVSHPTDKPTEITTGPSVDKRVSNSTPKQQPPSILSVPKSQRPPAHKLIGLDPKFCFFTTQHFDVTTRFRSRFAQCDFISSNGGRFLNVYTPRHKEHHVRTTLIRGAQGPMFLVREDWHSWKNSFWGVKPDIDVFNMQSKIGAIRQVGADCRPRHTITFINSARTAIDGSRTNESMTLRIAGSRTLGHIRLMMDHKNEQGAMVESCLAQYTKEHFSFGRKAQMDVRAGVDVALIAAFVGWVSNWRAIAAADAAQAGGTAMVMGA